MDHLNSSGSARCGGLDSRLGDGSQASEGVGL